MHIYVEKIYKILVPKCPNMRIFLKVIHILLLKPSLSALYYPHTFVTYFEYRCFRQKIKVKILYRLSFPYNLFIKISYIFHKNLINIRLFKSYPHFIHTIKHFIHIALSKFPLFLKNIFSFS